MPLHAFIEGVGLVGPGLSGWPEGAAVLAGTAPYVPRATELPPPEGLPPAERRRTGPAVKLALATGREAIAASGRDAATLPTVFSASGADGHNYHAICEALASDDPLLSPTRFHNSVHNAPAGYWGIATGAMTPSNVMCAHDASFGAGLLEALCQARAQHGACVLIAYDTDYPAPLRHKRPIPDTFGLALVLAPEASARSMARLDLELVPAANTPGTRISDPALETLRTAVPAARALPLLQALALGDERQVVLDYLDDVVMRIALSPCR
jgi:hypothetical protein